MTETKKESLSALIDGEATEIEVHRLVRGFREDESLSQSWAVYQHIRTTCRPGTDSGSSLSPAEHLSLFDRISSAVADEDSFEKAPEKPASPVKMVAGSLALAASLVVAVFIGVQQQAPEGTAPTLASGSGTAVNAIPVSTQPVSRPSQAVPAIGQDQAQELVELDEEKQRLLRAYLNQHDRMARMAPDTQMVNFKESAGK